MTQKSHSTDPLPAHEADDVGCFAANEIASAFGCLVADDPFRELEHRATLEALAQLPKPKPPRKPRRRALKTIAAEAKAAGFTSVTTRDGVTYTIGQAAELAPAGEQDPAEREIARLRALRGTR